MKAAVHPTYHKDTKVTCACGNTFTTGSVVPEIKVEICAVCHPFYTGTQKLVDTQGQVEKFTMKKSVAESKKVERQQIEARRAEKVQKTSSDRPSLRDLLMQNRKKASN